MNRALVLAVGAALVAVGVVQGHYLDWRPTGFLVGRDCTLDTRSTDDTCGAYVSALYWNSSRTSGLRHMLSEYDDYFTHDAKDNSANLNAVGAYSTLPLPYFDADNDTGGDAKWEEGEVTSEQQVFPNSGTNYYSRIHFMRWWKSCAQCSYQWDGGSGTITQVAQLSDWSLIGDRYNADPNFNGFTFGTTSYPTKSTPSSVAAIAEGDASTLAALDRRERLDRTAIGGKPAKVEAGAVRLAWTQDSGELHVQPDLSSGLDQYRGRSIRLATELLATDAANGVLTFSRPVSSRDLENLARKGLEIVAIEAVTEEYDGVRGTYFGLHGDYVWSQMHAIATEFSTTFLGVTSAEVRVPDQKTFDEVMDSPDVYLVDLGVEQGRRTAGTKDVVMNDLYWYLAGWATP